ncbi:MAG: MG2 domain-containing protein [Vicinamibacterales bacterium]
MQLGQRNGSATLGALAIVACGCLLAGAGPWRGDVRAATPAGGRQAPGAAEGLRVVQAGPTGEVASREQANEIRVIFSEPMVELGRIPEPVTVPYFRMRPTVPGTFRWSGSTILIFTPDPKTPLPLATRFDVTIEAGAQSIAGRRLGTGYAFAFTTPTVRLLRTDWYRKSGRSDGPVVAVLQFNQPVRPDDVLAHVSARFEPHAWSAPRLGPAAEERMRTRDPLSLAQFQTKVRTAERAASSSAAVPLALASTWNTTQFPADPTRVVIETVGVPPPESYLRVTIDAAIPSPAGRATPPQPQAYTIELEPTFFVGGMRCRERCDPAGFNPVELTRPVSLAQAARAVTVTDVTKPDGASAIARVRAVGERSQWMDETTAISLEDAGFDRQPPASTYAVKLAGELQSVDGQVLGYSWEGLVENWHERAFTSFGDGHGVWELDGGRQLPFYARNLRQVTQWAARLQVTELVPRMLELAKLNFRAVPPGQGLRRVLGGVPDKVQSHGLDLTRALGASGPGLAWAGVEDGETIARSERYPTYEDEAVGNPRQRSTIVQVTNLGISVKDSPQNTLVLVTRLDNGQAVAGAKVSAINLQNEVFWRAETDAEGVAVGPGIPVRDPLRPDTFSFVVTAEKDGDVAYVGSDWTEGIDSYSFGTPYSIVEAEPILRGAVFTDRGVYRLAEEVHFKAVLRRDTPSGIQLLPAGTPIHVTVRDSQSKELATRTVTANAWSTAEWTMTLPRDGALGSYEIEARLDKPAPRRPAENVEDEDRQYQLQADDYRYRAVHASFLVAAYRRPDFRVDATLSGVDPVAGQPLRAGLTARYLFGGVMAKRPLRWTVTRSPILGPPATLTENFPNDEFVFVGTVPDEARSAGQVAGDGATLDTQGGFTTTVQTTSQAGVPYQYTFEGDVEDVSHQHIANRASFVVHPAPWYVGVKRPPFFTDVKTGLSTAIVTLSPDGRAVGGVPVTLTLSQVQWHSVRRAEGGGFYAWDTRREEQEVAHWTVTSTEAPTPITGALSAGGQYLLRAVAKDDRGREAVTMLSFYAVGAGYTAWSRYDHNRIDLVPERKSYKPGDTARIMIQSPWEQATALVTTEREGVKYHRRFALTSTQQTVTVPIAERDIPNVFVSVLLIKGRTKVTGDDDASDPGKPTFRLGYTELEVEDRSKRLTVSVRANKEEYRPANVANVALQVVDSAGAPSESEVTLWAVDYGVLSLTAFRTPDVLRSVYSPKSLQVTTTDSRQRIVSRRVLTPKGADTGGGGGSDAMTDAVRKDFRVLAFWLGSVVTDAQGRATTDVKLPESLTTYRIMAVAGDRASRFGSADAEIRVSKPLTLRSTFPRFLALGDKARFGSVVTNQTAQAGAATVTIRSLDPKILQIVGDSRRQVSLSPGGVEDVRFDATALAVGRARVRMTVQLGAENDAFEDTVPVSVLAPAETVAAYGEARASEVASEKISVPTGVVPGVGGLTVNLASTAMVGLGEGARYLVEYPYGCAEQIASRALALGLASDLGGAFSLPGIDAKDLHARTQAAIDDLYAFQDDSGGFKYWVDACCPSAYLTSYVLHVLRSAERLKYDVRAEAMSRGYDFLAQQLDEAPPTNEGWWPAYTAWQAFAAKELVEAGRNADSVLTRLVGYADRLPVFGLAHLYDALAARGERGPRLDDVRRRLRNAVLPEGGSAHVEETSDPYLMWFWNSNVRSTAIALASLVGGDGDEPTVRAMVRWLMTARKGGRWGNTQENAWVMEALVAYYRKYESEAPDFTAVVSLGDQSVATAAFKGRSTEAERHELPMASLLAKSAPGSTRPLAFKMQGVGTLFYSARLQYVVDALVRESLSSGFAIDRSYATVSEDGKAGAPSTTFKAGDLVQVTLTFDLPKERRYVAVTDVVPAGLEPVESWFASTARSVARLPDEDDTARTWMTVWQRGGFDHVERHDDRVRLFATRLAEGRHQFAYLARATTSGTFRTAPAQVEEMYAPENFGRTSTVVVTVMP